MSDPRTIDFTVAPGSRRGRGKVFLDYEVRLERRRNARATGTSTRKGVGNDSGRASARAAGFRASGHARAVGSGRWLGPLSPIGLADVADRTGHSVPQFGVDGSLTLLAPLLLFAVLYVAFTRVVRFGGAIEHYASLLLFNIMPFTCTPSARRGQSRAWSRRRTFSAGLTFRRLVIPLSIALTSLFLYCFAFASPSGSHSLQESCCVGRGC